MFRRRLSTTTTAIRYQHQTTTANDAYYAVINHISNIIRHDHFMERTLNRLHPFPVPLTPPTVLRILNLTSPSNPIPSLRFFRWALSRPHSYSPTSHEVHPLLLSLARRRLFSSMWSLLSQMRSLSLRPPPSTFALIIRSYGDAGLPDLAVDVFNKMRHHGCEQDTDAYNALLHALCAARNFCGAYKLVRRMVRKNVALNRETYTVLVNGWCAAGKLKEAQEFLDEMSAKGFSPPVRGRDLLIDGLVSAGYLEAAKAMVTRMTKEGVLPDVKTFNVLLEALCNSGEIEFCMQILEEAGELGLCPDISTYKIMIPTVSKAGMIEEGFRLLYCCMEDGHKPFPSLYAAVVKALCKAGRFGDAFSFFGDMKEKGHPPNRPVYTMLVKMCVRGGKFVEAANYLVEMTEMGLVPRGQSFDMVVDGLKHCGKHDLAKRMEQMEGAEGAELRYGGGRVEALREARSCEEDGADGGFA